MTMNKGDLVSYIAENSQTGLSKKQAEEAVELHWAGIEDALSKGDKVQLVGTITLEPAPRSARKGFNPQTKAEIEIPAKMGVKTKPGKNLEKSVADISIAEFKKKKEKESK
ncbi:DNA-binding protein HU [compost metagenome]